MEVQATWGRAVRVWWAFLWRNLLAVIAAVLMGAIVGGIIGAILGAMGVTADTVRLVTAPIGGIMGLLISIIPIKLILNKDFGEFRLVLLSERRD